MSTTNSAGHDAGTSMHPAIAAEWDEFEDEAAAWENLDFWPSIYREHAGHEFLLKREWLGMPRGPLSSAMLSGTVAVGDLARTALHHAIINGQLLRCYPT